MKKDIDIYTWKRKKHFEYYQEFDNPCFSININIDITALIDKTCERNLKFFPSFLFCLMKAMNQVEELKFRVRDNKVVIHDLIHPSYTVLNETENFVFCYSRFIDDFDIFYNSVLEDILMAIKGNNLSDEGGRDDLVFVSSVPWIAFNSITHPFKKDDPHSIPRVTFGKYFKEGKTIKLPISVQAHHGLVDGLHIARLLERINEAIVTL